MTENQGCWKRRCMTDVAKILLRSNFPEPEFRNPKAEMRRIPELSQQPRVRFEPFLGLDEIGTKPGNFTPKTGRMIHLAQMREFVEHDIIAHEFRRLHQAPIKGNGATPGA